LDSAADERTCCVQDPGSTHAHSISQAERENLFGRVSADGDDQTVLVQVQAGKLLLQLLQTLQVGSGSDNLERPPFEDLIDREYNCPIAFPQRDPVTAAE
jgi:hypothetical protein